MSRPFTVIDVEQGTPEWLTARLGRLTSTCAVAMLSKGKGNEEAVGKRNLRMKLALERITGKPVERGVKTDAMQWGTDTEARARFAYEILTGRAVNTSGFLAHTDLMVGTSLDAHYGDYEGICEFKCPNPATHWEYLDTGIVPTEYRKQCVHALYVSGARWCDWMSYDPAFPESLQAKVVRIARDEAEIAAYAVAANAFLSQVDALVMEIRRKADVEAVYV